MARGVHRCCRATSSRRLRPAPLPVSPTVSPIWSQRWPLGEECLRTVGDESVGLFVEGGNAPGYTWPTGVLPVPGCRACVRERKVRQQLHDGLLCRDDAPGFCISRGDGRERTLQSV